MAAARLDLDAQAQIGICVFFHDFLQPLCFRQYRDTSRRRISGVTFAARGVISTSIGLPSSSVLGLTVVACCLTLLEKVRKLDRNPMLFSCNPTVRTLLGLRIREEGGGAVALERASVLVAAKVTRGVFGDREDSTSLLLHAAQMLDRIDML